MNLKKLRSVCFTICIVSVIAGLILALGMIWGGVKDSQLAWKALMSLGLFFLSASLTLSVARFLGGPVQE